MEMSENGTTASAVMSNVIHEAKLAVLRDDVETLKRLLHTPEPNLDDRSDATTQLHILTEKSLVNQHTGENLLHFAVHQMAPKSVQLLISPPYCWDPYRPDVMGRTPIQLVEARGYLPVWYPVAAHSKMIQTTVVVPHSHIVAQTRSVAAFLINPVHFLNAPFEWLGEILGITEFPLTGKSVSLFNKYNEYDEDLSVENLVLFFELFVATPEAVHVPSTNPAHIWGITNIRVHPLDCHSYPQCLMEVIRSSEFRQLDPGLQLRSLVDSWGFHQIICGGSQNGNFETIEPPTNETPQKKTDPAFIRPLSLLRFCRVCFRRMVTNKLKDLSTSNDPRDLAQNYASLVAKLSLPSRLHAFISYEDLWPAWKTQIVPNQSGKVKSPPLTWGTILDPWFEDSPSSLFIRLQQLQYSHHQQK
ncbi:unnamed protein product [Calicophoron daubneyi]|uniref:Uncharacterized protein n=1 Tax=Calicophoron daubneyi TaxID=300641 RepID=A0AAV2T8R0_CALDB